MRGIGTEVCTRTHAHKNAHHKCTKTPERAQTHRVGSCRPAAIVSYERTHTTIPLVWDPPPTTTNATGECCRAPLARHHNTNTPGPIVATRCGWCIVRVSFSLGRAVLGTIVGSHIL
mmetsp:Transcript_14135/g.32586  ORF Transcript_14135/g.32586 Transcript_14135/m.32586 type:complete len:117 (-) Transcript_14135:134-484(-)